MKKSFLGLRSFLLLLLLLAFSLTNLQAAAPASVSGWTFYGRITEGRFGYGKSGSFLFCISDSGTEFRNVSLSNLADTTGTCTYQASGSEGKLTMGNVVMTFSFTDGNDGNYTLIRGGDIVNGYQRGNFSAIGGIAPDSLDNKVLDFNGSRAGVAGSTVNYRLSSGVGSYSIIYETGASPLNSFSQEKINASTTRAYFNDSILGNGQNHLVFSTPTSGLFVYKIGDTKAYDIGTFLMQETVSPQITLQPGDQTLPHGGRAVFSSGAIGTQPLVFQWFKDGAPIAGANKPRYVVDPVTAGDAGTYQLTVSSFLGSDTSQEARLTALCPTVIDRTYKWFDYTGGTGKVKVTNSICAWDVTTTNRWITIVSGQNTFGGGTMTYSVAPNTRADPRTGYLLIGTETFKVAQQGTYAPDNLTGKTLRTDMEIGTEEFPTNAPFFFAMNRGTENSFYLSALDGVAPNPFAYSYQKINETTAQVTFSPHETMLLTFSNFTSGMYFRTNTTNDTSFEGPFMLSQRRGDWTIDGHSDLTWQNTNGELRVSYTIGSFVTNVVEQTNTLSRFIGANDFTRDGNLDFVHFIPTLRVLGASIGGTTNAFLFRGGAKVNPSWRVVSTEDISGDQRPDILFQNKDGKLAYWQIGPATNYFSRAVTVRGGRPTHSNWFAVAVADMNGDRQPDIVIWNNVTSQVAVWLFNNGDFVNAEMLCAGENPGRRWRVRAVADMNYDGHNDLLWQHTNGNVRIWYLNGTQRLTGELPAEKDMTDPAPDPAWTLTGPK